MSGACKVLLLLSFFTFTKGAFGVIDFEKQVWPILESRCVECHKAPYELNGKLKEPKAGLRLDGAAHLMFGGDGGVVVVTDHPSQSPLYQRVVLPLDDSEHMPPKGDPLTHAQKEILRKWIAQGLDFGKWIGQVDGVEELAQRKEEESVIPVPEHIRFYTQLSGGLEALPDNELSRIASETNLMIRPIGIGNSLLEARVVTNPDQVGDAEIKRLLPIADYLTKLDLRNTQISERSLVYIGGFPKLTELNLRGTEIGNSGLGELVRLPGLQTLNLCETEVSDDGLRWLRKIKSLRQVFLWNSEVSSPARLRLAEMITVD